MPSSRASPPALSFEAARRRSGARSEPAAGINRLAVVVARHGLGKIATEAIISKFEKTAFQTHMFDSLPEALKWTSEP
jgi:hypothetical protein